MKVVKRIVKSALSIPRHIFHRTSLGRDISRTAGTAGAFTFQHWFVQRCLGVNREAYWPVHFSSIVTNARRIKIGIGTAPGLSPGCYIQGINGIEIGDYTIVAPNVGLISASHSMYDFSQHEASGPIRIGRYCWIGMNAVILPGVELGDHTVVAAGAVVTKSFAAGYCVIGGIPAGILRELNPADMKESRNKYEYLGFHPIQDGGKSAVFRRVGIDE